MQLNFEPDRIHRGLAKSLAASSVRPITPDVIAMHLLLDNAPQAAFDRLAKLVEDARNPACPECGARNMDDNGLPGDDADFGYCCRACGNHHYPNGV